VSKEIAVKNNKQVHSFETKDYILNAIESIKNKRTTKEFEKNPDLPNQYKRYEIEIIEQYTNNLEKIRQDLIPYAQKIKHEHIHDITESSLNCAIYLLICHTLEVWEAILLLAKNSFNSEMMDLTRHVKETLELIHLFLIKGNDSGVLKKWFAGETIPNREARKAIKKEFDEWQDNSKVEVNISSILAHIYDKLSLHTHSSYHPMLESVDVFNKDFDFKKYANTHFTMENLRFVNTIMGSTLVIMKKNLSVSERYHKL
jgi:hypothetical protein